MWAHGSRATVSEPWELPPRHGHLPAPLRVPEEAHIGCGGWAQHTHWFGEAGSPNNSWLRPPELRPRIPAGRWLVAGGEARAFLLAEQPADLGSGVWGGPPRPRLPSFLF